MPTGNGEKPQFYRQWTVEDSQNGLCAKKFIMTKNSISLNSMFVDLENLEEHATLMLIAQTYFSGSEYASFSVY